MVDLTLIAQIAVIGIAAFAAWKIYNDAKAPGLTKDVPQYRAQPVVITKMGLKIPKKVITLANSKVQIHYGDGYSPIYYMGENFTDLIEIDHKQMILGKNRPVYIEQDKLLELAYSYEHAPTRKLLKQQLGKIINELPKRYSEKKLDKYFTQLKGIVDSLETMPSSYKKVKGEYEKAKGQALKRESDLRKAEAGTEGRIARRVEGITEIAVKRAGKESSRDNL